MVDPAVIAAAISTLGGIVVSLINRFLASAPAKRVPPKPRRRKPHPKIR
jgi:hypothetical protein